MAVSKIPAAGTYTKPDGGIPDSDIASAANWNTGIASIPPITVQTGGMTKARFDRSSTSGNMFIDFIISDTDYYRLCIYGAARTDRKRLFLEHRVYENTWNVTTVWEIRDPVDPTVTGT